MKHASPPVTSPHLPIGVFDSGMGGLTVLKQLKTLLPHEQFIYLGDTARLPYGTKSPETIIQYALQNTELLVRRGIKLLVVACNTASAVALRALETTYPKLPIIGVLEPGARAAVRNSAHQHMTLLATETTITAGGYQAMIKRLSPNAIVKTQSCGLLVALAEEGWTDNAVTDAAIQMYLSPILNQDPAQDCVILGCTHFPVFTAQLKKHLGDRITLIDSAIATAEVVSEKLERLRLNREETQAQTTFLVTDSPERFARIGQLFLGETIAATEVQCV